MISDELLLHTKSEVIDSFIRHELGLPLRYTNSEYDRMYGEVKLKEPNFNPFKFMPVPIGAEVVEHRPGIIGLEKYSPENNDIVQYWNQEKGKIKLPKYDGSSLVIYYTSGKFSHIASMSDKDSGIIQTEKFRSFVPQTAPSYVSFIRVEALVDTRLYENARGKANGLVNSKYMQDEVEELVTLVGYTVVDLDGKIIPWKKVINAFPQSEIMREGSKLPKFMFSPECHEITLAERGVGHYVTPMIDFKFCLDGIVYTEDDKWNCIWCYKYDYLVAAKTTVTDISWRETNGEGFTSVLVVEPVELDNKWIYGPSTNGVPKMIELGCGIGSVIEVVFSGMTIPKVINVITEAPITYPTCQCGNYLDETKLAGAILKCDNPECSRKLELRQIWMDSHLLDKPEADKDLNDKEYILKYLEWFVFTYLNIARFNIDNARWYDFNPVTKSQLLEVIKNEDVEGFKEIIKTNYYLTSLMSGDVDRNSLSTIKIINKHLHD